MLKAFTKGYIYTSQIKAIMYNYCILHYIVHFVQVLQHFEYHLI